MITILNFLLFNLSFLFGYDVNQESYLVQKGDSCLIKENYSCAIQYYSKVDEKVIKFETEKDRMLFYLNYSDALYTIGNYPEANIQYQQLKALAIENQNKFYQAKALTGAAHALWRMTDNVNSIHEILDGIKIFEELKDTSNLIIASNILAGIYVSIQKYEDARGIYQEMLGLAIQSNDTFNIASNYEYLGIVDYFEGEYQSAINNYEKSLEINEKGDNSFRISINLANIAESKMELKKYQEALDLLYQAIKIQQDHEYKSVLIYSYYTIGKIHTHIQSYDSGLYYYERSLQLMDETSETRDKNEVYRLIAKNYAEQGSFNKAYEYHQMHSAAKDSLIASERTHELEEIKTRYEVENKEKENEDLLLQNSEKQKELVAQKELIQLQYAIGILIVLFLIISLFLAFKLYRVRQTLINANKSKDKLFGIIAHDLKGPIGNIEAMLQLLQMEKIDSRKSEYFEYISKSIQNLSALTSQLLSWTFSHKGDFNFIIEKLSVKEISDRTIDLFDYQLSNKGIKIINSIENDLFVLADENALLTIFRNLISNAVKFTSKGGEIVLEAEKQNIYIEIKIKDSGVGMTKGSIRKVLEGQHVMSSSGTENEKGSGLGFSIVIEFIRKLKGKIDIKSDGENGSTIILKLKKA